MKVCILGDGLTSLTLAKALVNEGIYVDIVTNKKKKSYDKIRTIGVSKSNIEFFNTNILDIRKLLWDINKIEIFTDNFKSEKLLNFEDNDKLFSIIKNYDLYNLLLLKLNKNKFFTFKKKINYKNYKLIINCDLGNEITKKIFHKKIMKNYESYAHTALIDHKEITKNHTAIQIFTKRGPIAFLPISKKQTSIVYSARGKKDVDLEILIKRFEARYKNVKINKIHIFELKSSILRSYYYKNILAFGGLLHKVHPLAGQGFNMSIRDIRELIKLIKFRIDHGLDLDNSICIDFEKKIKHKNYLFFNGIDFIYEFFNLESKIKNPLLNKSIQIVGKNKIINKFFIKFANNGIIY